MKNVLLVQTSPGGKECPVYMNVDVDVEPKLCVTLIYLADFRKLAFTCSSTHSVYITFSSSTMFIERFLDDEMLARVRFLNPIGHKV